MAVTIHRQDNQPVFVLHTYPFKETSLVVELFSREFGRVAAVAKGARRPRSAMRGMLQAFQPLQATWSGKAELKNLHSMEWGSGLLLLRIGLRSCCAPLCCLCDVIISRASHTSLRK